MPNELTTLIIGASMAGAKAAEAMRSDGASGPIILVGAEPTRPYERPPLSKALLRGEGGDDQAFIHEDGFYSAHDIDLRTGVRIDRIDPATKTAWADDGTQIPFDRALIATGARPRTLDVPGSDLAGIHYLRTLDDALALRADLQRGGHLVVVGAGWIGSEVAASARQMGCDVTIVDPLSVPLERVLGAEVGAVYRDLHAQHGVDLRHTVKVEGFKGGQRVEAVLTDAGQIGADTVVVGIGAIPNTDLAAAAGLDVDGGIVVDEHLRTSHPDIYAAGDVAAAWHPVLNARVRVDHWSNALNQGLTAGHGLSGVESRYTKIPYFFSDQYDLGMEYVGHPQRWDRVVFRGTPEAQEFLAFWLDGGRVVAAMNANIWDVNQSLTALVEAGATPAPDQLADPDVPLDRLLGA